MKGYDHSQYPLPDDLRRRKQREGLATPQEKIARSRANSALVERLAKRWNWGIDELLERIPLDTLARLKYPLTEIVQEDGTRVFKDPIRVTEIQSQYAGDRGRTHKVE